MVKFLKEKRIPLNTLVMQSTKDTIDKKCEQYGLSQGKLIDILVILAGKKLTKEKIKKAERE